jgi:ABC-type amino acid transport substrate-binding protein
LTNHGHANNKSSLPPIKVVTIATHAYAPYYNKKGKGVIADIYQAIFTEMNIELKLKVLPIKRGVQELMMGKVDAFSPGAIFLTSKQKIDTVNDNIFNVMITWMSYWPTSEKNTKEKSLKEMKGERCGVIMNSPYLSVYNQFKINYIKTETPRQLVKMIKHNRVQHSEITLFSGLFLSYNLYPKETEKFHFQKRETLSLGLSFLKKSLRSKKVRAKIQQGFKQIIKAGTYIEILESYWGDNNIPREILPTQLKHLGKSEISKKLFHSYKRNSYGRIIRP